MALRRDEWLLLFIGLPGDRYPTDRIRLMKGLFLFSQQGPVAVGALYDFKPYDYGPFDTRVYRDLDALLADGSVVAEPGPTPGQTLYRLTTPGEGRFSGLLARAPKRAVGQLAEIKQLVTRLGFVELLRDVYQRYPAYAAHSIARL